MPSICFYFQVHQPFRIKRFTYFDSANDLSYFDEDLNRQITEKVAHKCYLPANELMLHLIKKHQGEFRVSYSITGVALEQFEKYSPETLHSFKQLADTGCVEFLAETYHHSLSSVFRPEEFRRQVDKHSDMMKKHFGITPKVFRNTELIYNDELGKHVAELGYKAMIAEGADDVLGWRSPNFVYSYPNSPMKLLLKNYKLSDDIAFRFSNQGWDQHPLTTDKFADWTHAVSGCGDVVNLFMDYETFGEHQWECSGIFQFMEHLPEAILNKPDWDFKTPTQVIHAYPSMSEIHCERLTSWADEDRSITAWRGNKMQESALQSIYELCDSIEELGDSVLEETWRKLQTSDHFYYMCTKFFADGDVHAYFSPFDSPYDAFINYMNVMKDFKKQVENKRSNTPE